MPFIIKGAIDRQRKKKGGKRERERERKEMTWCDLYRMIPFSPPKKK